MGTFYPHAAPQCPPGLRKIPFPQTNYPKGSAGAAFAVACEVVRRERVYEVGSNDTYHQQDCVVIRGSKQIRMVIGRSYDPEGEKHSFCVDVVFSVGKKV